MVVVFVVLELRSHALLALDYAADVLLDARLSKVDGRGASWVLCLSRRVDVVARMV